MNRLLLIITFLALTGVCAEAVKLRPRDIDEQLERLDGELSRRTLYIKGRQDRIDSLREMIDSAKVRDRQWLDNVMALGNRFNSFNMDSAIIYYSRGYERASQLGLDSIADAFNLRRAAIYPVVGFVYRAMNIYDSMDTAHMAKGLWPLYYDSGRQMYSYISSFYFDYPEEFGAFREATIDSQQELIGWLDPESPGYQLNLGEYYYATGEYTKAKVLLEELIENLSEDDPRYGRTAHILSDIALARNNHDEYLYYLILSSIGDTRSATLEVSSLQQLGRELYEKGDINRAHHYLLMALDGAVQGDATLRLIQTAQYLPLIEGAHRAQLDRERNRNYLIMGMMAVLLVVLVSTVLFIRREMKQMAELQRRLERANQMKDVYISQFLSLCSIYMEKLNQFCKIANRKISAGQVEDLYKMTKSGRFVEEQSREFYDVFDNAFLNLYPTFVESVNELLRPEERIVLAEYERLNNELRILAFMRLGIEDSGKIAQVLNYSVNTIYTYRNKLRNKAINRDTFEDDIMKISSVV